jgi:hypothetical protein
MGQACRFACPPQFPPDAGNGDLPSSQACRPVVLIEASLYTPLNGKLYDPDPLPL